MTGKQIIDYFAHMQGRESVLLKDLVARFVGPLLGIDPDAPEPVLRVRIEAFFRGVRFRPADFGDH